jgi:hypothetical protein
MTVTWVAMTKGHHYLLIRLCGFFLEKHNYRVLRSKLQELFITDKKFIPCNILTATITCVPIPLCVVCESIPRCISNDLLTRPFTTCPKAPLPRIRPNFKQQWGSSQWSATTVGISVSSPALQLCQHQQSYINSYLPGIFNIIHV